MSHEIDILIEQGNYQLAEEKLSALKHMLGDKHSDLTIFKYEMLLLLSTSNVNLVKGKVETFLSEKTINIVDKVLFNIKNIYTESLWRLNHLEKALEVSEALKNTFIQLNTDSMEDKKNFGYLYYNLSRIYVYSNNFDLAEEYAQKSLEIRKNLPSKLDLAETLNVIGIIHGYKGLPDDAIDYYQQSLSLRKEIGNKRLIAYTINNIGENYRLKGEEDKALICYQECLDICLKLNDKQGIRLGLFGSGSIYLSQNKLVEALKSFQMCLEYFDDNASPFHMIEMLFQTIRIKLILKKDYQVELNQVKALQRKFSDETIQFYAKMTEAFILKESTRVRTKLKAQEIFEEILHEKHLNIEYVILVMQSLVELYLIELQISDDTTILEDINKILSQMNSLAKEQNFFPLMIKTSILRARFALLINNIDQCLEILDEAEVLINNKNLSGFNAQIDQERKFINHQFSKWQALVETKAPMYQKIQESHILNYLQDIEKLLPEE